MVLSKSEPHGALIFELLALCRTELLGSFGLSCVALSKSELQGSLISKLLALCRTELRGSDSLGSSRTELRGSFIFLPLGKCT